MSTSSAESVPQQNVERQTKLMREALDRVRYEESERLQQEALLLQRLTKRNGTLPTSLLVAGLAILLLIGIASSYFINLFFN